MRALAARATHLLRRVRVSSRRAHGQYRAACAQVRHCTQPISVLQLYERRAMFSVVAFWIAQSGSLTVNPSALSTLVLLRKTQPPAQLAASSSSLAWYSCPCGFSKGLLGGTLRFLWPSSPYLWYERGCAWAGRIPCRQYRLTPARLSFLDHLASLSRNRAALFQGCVSTSCDERLS
ncbi:hypothetical protein BC834DRAFT_240027 [Gloeopeniophorella convolvens]|nr:hypothetical protein BC834DRAFT_240027 [Gloeopeniophorella convolvens]